MSQQKRNTEQKGITLISLVITVVILLILAEVAISINVGTEGLFSKAQQVKEDWNGEVANEEIEINKLLEHEEIKGIKQTTDEDATTIAQKDANTYLIQSIEDLVLLSKAVNTGETTYEGKIFELEANLSFTSEKSYVDSTAVNFEDLGDINGNGTPEALMVELTTGNGFIPIGKYENSTSYEFKGTILGNNNVLDGLYVANRNYAGFIGRSGNVTIKDLTLTKANVKTTEGNSYTYAAAFIAYNTDQMVLENIKCEGTVEGGYAGGIVGYNYTSSETNSIIVNIKNCTNNAKVTSTLYGAGILGYVNRTNSVNIENCENKADVLGYAGILGFTNHTNNINVINCKNTAKIESSYASGLAGYLNNIGETGSVTIRNSSNEGDVIGGRAGIAGMIYAKSGSSSEALTVTIDNCNNSGNLTLTGNAGGIVGESYRVANTIITNCYNTGNIEGGNLGGILGRGYYKITIQNCYNTGDITGTNVSNTGGIFGYYSTTATDGLKIENCYNEGDITGSGSYISNVGGICAYGNSEAIIKECYNSGNISGDSVVNAGGICGSNAKSITDCYNTGDITGQRCIAGIVGYYVNTIDKVYNSGKITATENDKGGILGRGYATISNAFNLGTIDDKDYNTFAGSIVGAIGSASSVTNSYYLEGTYSAGVYIDPSTTPDNTGVRSLSEITTLMNSTLTSPTWEAGEDGYPVLSCFNTEE